MAAPAEGDDPVRSAGGSARRIVIVANPISGRGRAGRMADDLARDLGEAGHDPVQRATELAPPETWLDPVLGDADLLVVVGGDGAVRLAADSAARAGVPIYHLPLGTENLFAREFGSDRRWETVRDAIAAWRVVEVDLAATDTHTFVLMASIGFDADVVHDLAARRRGAITHLSYLPPILRRAVAWRGARLTIDVDDRRLVDDRPGTVIVANSRQYGGRLDPAARAKMDDGAVDVVFLPARTALGAARWAAECRLRTAGRRGGAPRDRGATVRIRADRPVHVQLDGDPGGAAGDRVTDLTVTVRPRCLRVLTTATRPAPAPATDPDPAPGPATA